MLSVALIYFTTFRRLVVGMKVTDFRSLLLEIVTFLDTYIVSLW